MFRAFQGVAGAGLIPLSQATLLRINPPERHGQAMAIFGIGTIFGPITFDQLHQWALDAQVSPLDKVSSDEKTWLKAPMVPELEMDYLIEVSPALLAEVRAASFVYSTISQVKRLRLPGTETGRAIPCV